MADHDRDSTTTERNQIEPYQKVPMEFDFDGNELSSCIDPISRREISCVYIHEDRNEKKEEDDEEANEDIIIDEHTNADTSIVIDRDRLANECESLRTSIDRTRLKLVELERRLEQATAAAAAPSAPSSSAPSYSSFLHHHNHTTPLNPSHLSHRDAHSNQFHTPVVPLTTVLQLQPLEMVESSTTTDTIVDGVGVKSSDLAKVSTTPHSHDTTAAGESHPHARLPPCLSIAGLKNYVRKFQGQHVQTLPVSGWKDLLLAFIAGFIGIAVPALLNFNMLHAAGKDNFILIIASFGASAVLLYGVPMSDFSQPRNVIGGHAISAAIGVAVRHLVFASDADSDQPSPYTGDFLDLEWLGCALAVSLSIIAMNLTKTTHPPGGATALQACLVNSTVKGVDWRYIGFMTATASTMTLIAIIFNNIPRKRIYPKFWL